MVYCQDLRIGLARPIFARVLNHLTREELDGASLVVPGRTRRHVITEVGYQARALTRLTEWTASGVATPMFADPAQRLEEIADGATLPDRALRGLFHHAAVHLDVEWRGMKQVELYAKVRYAVQVAGLDRSRDRAHPPSVPHSPINEAPIPS